jgi:two-component system, OmpR family, phosphate regulon sensor histidine kinase PhoR
MTSIPWKLASRAALLAAVALFLGLVFGGLLAWLLGAAVVMLVYLGRNLYRLERWMRSGMSRSQADGEGLFAPLCAEIIQLKQRARRRKKRFHRLLREVRDSTEAMQDGGVILNAELDIVWLNEAAERLLALDFARDRGQNIDNLVRHPLFIGYLEQGDFTGKLKMPGPARNSHLAMQLIPYGNQQRLLLVQDITREMRLEIMRRDFVANASHELRSPLTVIGGYLEALLEDEDLEEAWHAPVAEMKRQARRMDLIVHDLITLSRLESAERAAGGTPVDVPAMLSMLVREAQSRKDRPHTVELQLDTDMLLRGEEQELHSVFSNLINNALRFTPAEGRVACRWWQDDEGVHFSITDTGIGIPEEAIPRVTERFFRVDSGRAREVGGTGLGLAIVKHSLLRHDARLTIESKPGEGSTFGCHFPPGRAVAPAAAAEAVV